MVRKLNLSKEEIPASMVDVRLRTAISLAEQRMLTQVNEDSPAQLSLMTVRAFWSDLWDCDSDPAH